jgi:hypothetical protein
MVFYLFYCDFTWLRAAFSCKRFVFSYFCLDIHRVDPADYALVGFGSSPRSGTRKT